MSKTNHHYHVVSSYHQSLNSHDNNIYYYHSETQLLMQQHFPYLLQLRTYQLTPQNQKWRKKLGAEPECGTVGDYICS